MRSNVNTPRRLRPSRRRPGPAIEESDAVEILSPKSALDTELELSNCASIATHGATFDFPDKSRPRYSMARAAVHRKNRCARQRKFFFGPPSARNVLERRPTLAPANVSFHAGFFTFVPFHTNRSVYFSLAVSLMSIG